MNKFGRIAAAAGLLAVAGLGAHGGTILTVPGTSDPWLANAAIDNEGTPEPADVAPDQSPVLFGSVTPGMLVSWSATGTVGHPGDESGPDGVSWYFVSRYIGAANGIDDLSAPINSLIGVWMLDDGTGVPFYMGSTGSAIAPAGASELFLGTMDGYGWANNTGAFDVDITVPDSGSTAVLLVLGTSVLAFVRRKIVR